MVMGYILDTNILIAFLNNDLNVVTKLKEIDHFYTSCISVGELYYGANISQKTEKNIEMIKGFLECLQIFNISSKTAIQYASIKAELKHKGTPISENDIWIAAIAQENELTVVSRDKHLLNLDLIKTEKW
jgi:tRNA(fMet)-specific endonuclease VapC